MTTASATLDPEPALLAPAEQAEEAAREGAAGAVDDPLEHGRFTRWVVGEHGERLAESSLLLSGLHCAACAGIIEGALLGVNGVRMARVAPAAQVATVRWDPQATRPSALIAAVRAAGYDAVPDAAAPARALRRREYRQGLWRLFVAGFCAMQVMMMATPSYVAEAGDLAPDMRVLLNWGSWILTLPVLAFSAGPFFKGAWRSLRTRTIGMDVPVALGIVITFVASTGATFDPAGPFGHEVYFDSLTMFVSFLLGARFVEARARHRAAEALEASLARLPETAWRVDADGVARAVSVLRLVPGDRVRVPAGQAFPADGVLLEGRTQADEALLTGESVPVPKDVGAEVVAGSVNLGAPVTMQAQRVGNDTRFEAIVSMMRSAASQRPAAARVADRWAAPFLWTVLALAAGAAAVWSVVDPTRAVWVAVSVLIVTCPCALSLAAPAALVASLGAFARRGITVQRLDAVERLARIDHVFFDKTGTLSSDRLQLERTQLTAAGESEFGDAAIALELVLARAASLAAWSTHPVSRALVAAAGEGGRNAEPPWHGIEEVAGRGLRAVDAQGREWRLGAAHWVRAVQADLAPADDDTAHTGLGRDGVLLARFEFGEAVREGAREAVQALQREGIAVSLLSGDTPARAQRLAERVGITDVVGGATPADKLAVLEAAQAAGRVVAMVGDGVNDAPVLARADVSLAMGQGALVARGQADAVIASGHLADVVSARARARRTLAIVRQNMVWAAAYNAVCIPLALVGWLPPWAAGLGMAGSSLAVVLNALRASR
ncbi:MAG: cadmium-translocating P-type ATPase [Betaproteobacteria bacterium]|nr:cadmium-translocating P-type ATPase [Betaproteobacteria bacterium]MCC6249672.1 cadmium-translocating P-type ATPase [Rubrivivax sp.]